MSLEILKLYLNVHNVCSKGKKDFDKNQRENHTIFKNKKGRKKKNVLEIGDNVISRKLIIIQFKKKSLRQNL